MTVLSRRPAAIRIRSALYLAGAVAATLLFLPLIVLLAAPLRVGWPVLRAYVGVQLWLLRVICGQRVRVTGAEHLPEGPFLIAARHESMWETLFLPYRFDNPAVLLKQEILRYPLAGPIARKLGYVGIDRSGDLDAARAAFAQAKAAVAEGRRVLIFPSGTRDPARRDAIQPGVSVLYRQLGVPCVPISHNSGDLWPHRSWLKYPGEIEVRVHPAVPAGMKTRELMAALTRDLGPGARPGVTGPGTPARG